MSSNHNTGIYHIVNMTNGKRYVGSAMSFAHRFRVHLCQLAKGKHHSKHLQASWTKYGATAFEFRPMEICTSDLLITREQAHINRFNPAYNICRVAGSPLGTRHSVETRHKQSAKAKLRIRRPMSIETRALLSRKLTGKVRTPEQRAHCRAKTQAFFSDPAKRAKARETTLRIFAERPELREQMATRLRETYNERPELREAARQRVTGRKLSEAHRAAIGMAHKGRVFSDEHRAKIKAAWARRTMREAA